MFKLICTGNVGKAPTQRANNAGETFVTFSLGVSIGTKQNPKTNWVEISCNGKLAEVAAKYIVVGSKILVEGFPTANAYINKENKAVGTLRISANNIEFLSSNKSEHTQEVNGNVKDNEPPF